MSVDVVTFNEVLAQSRELKQKMDTLLKSADPRLDSYATNQALIDTKNQLDATIKSNAPARSYTNERGVKLDNINVALSTRASQSSVDSVNAALNRVITSMRTVSAGNSGAAVGKELLSVVGNGHIELIKNTSDEIAYFALVIDGVTVLSPSVAREMPFKNIRFRRSFQIINNIINTTNQNLYYLEINYSLY